MKRILLLAWLCAFAQAGAGAASDGEGASGAHGEPLRLYYLFSPRDPQQVARLLHLRHLSRDPTRPFHLVAAPRALAPVPAPLAAHPSGDGDWAVLVDGRGRVLAAGEGRHVQGVLAALVSPVVSTEVDESTWGKIKELFR